MSIEGWVEAGFEPVRRAFADNFARTDAFRELGAGLAAYRGGRCVVNLRAGHADAARARPWTEDTLANVWSATKGVTAVAVAKLVDEGALTYETRVASVWPEFAQNGKAEITLDQLMSHQAGLPGFAEPTTIEDQYDWEACCAKLARQVPAWVPGTASSYHAATFGWLAGEVVRRVTGVSLGSYLREAVAGPLQADVFVGLPEALEPRVAELLAPREPPPLAPAPDLPWRMALENPVQDPAAVNTRAWRAAEMPALNGQASALGLARLYAGLGTGARAVLSEAGVERLTRPATTDNRPDRLMGFEDSWGMGVMLNPDDAYGPGRRAFGHSGWGGSFGCADPERQLSIGYVCNQMGSALVFDPRSVALSAAVSACAARA